MTDPISNERLAEMLAGLEGVTPGPWGVWREPTFTMADAIRELTFQVENTPVEDFAKAVYLLDAGGKCPATTGCGPSSAANAAHIARCDPDTIRSLIEEVQASRRQSPAGAEPVAWVTEDILAAMKRGERVVPGWKKSDDFCIPLYASPPPKTVTITDEMVERVFQAVMPFMAGTAYRELRAAITAVLSSEANNGQ